MAILVLTGRAEPVAEDQLFAAVRSGDAARVRTLLEGGANSNVRGEQGATPIIVASARGYIDIVKLLLQHGADINARDESEFNLSALMVSALQGRVGVVSLLLDRNADVNLKNIDGATALTHVKIIGPSMVWKDATPAGDPAKIDSAKVADLAEIVRLLQSKGAEAPGAGLVNGLHFLGTYGPDPKKRTCFSHLESCGPSGAELPNSKKQ